MLKDHLKENKLSNNVVHLELASIGSVDYMRNILDTVTIRNKKKMLKQKIKNSSI